MNIYILYKLIQQIKKVINTSEQDGQRPGFELKGGGCLFWMLKKMFRIIDRSVVDLLLQGQEDSQSADCFVLRQKAMEDVSIGCYVWTRFRYIIRGCAVRDCIDSGGKRDEYMAYSYFPCLIHW